LEPDFDFQHRALFRAARRFDRAGRQRPQSGVIVAALALFSRDVLLHDAKYMLTSFLVPMYSIVNFFNTGHQPEMSSIHDWSGMPSIFGVPIYPSC